MNDTTNLAPGRLAVAANDNKTRTNGTAVLLRVDAIKENTQRGGRGLNTKHVEKLKESLKRQGLLQPLVVRKSAIGEIYDIVAGLHRLAAIRELGWREALAIILDSDDDRAEAACITENVVREPLRGEALSKAIARLDKLEGRKTKRGRPAKNSKSATQKAAASKLGISQSKLSRAEARNNVVPELTEAFESKRVTTAVVDELAPLSHEEQRRLLPHIEGKTRNEVRQIKIQFKEKETTRHSCTPASSAPADCTDAAQFNEAIRNFGSLVGQVRGLAEAILGLLPKLDAGSPTAHEFGKVEQHLDAFEQLVRMMREQIKLNATDGLAPKSALASSRDANEQDTVAPISSTAQPSNRKLFFIDQVGDETEAQAEARHGAEIAWVKAGTAVA